MNHAFKGALGGIVGAWLALVACGSSSSTPSGPCNVYPWQCPSGQTCSPTDARHFNCVTSGAHKSGEACKTAFGVADCADGLMCLQPTSGAGTCAPFCDPDNLDAHGCPPSDVCTTVFLGSANGPSVHLCAPPVGPANDGGPGSG
jgi:hypothetical protein